MTYNVVWRDGDHIRINTGDVVTSNHSRAVNGLNYQGRYVAQG